MSRAQRMRVEKGMERAEAVGAKMEVKVMRKGERERVGRERGVSFPCNFVLGGQVVGLSRSCVSVS